MIERYPSGKIKMSREEREERSKMPLVYAEGRYGAPMGRNDCNRYHEPDEPMYLSLVPMHNEYDIGGVYWGLSSTERVYMAWGWNEDGDPIEVFVWGKNRDHAKSEVSERMGQDVRFMR